MVTASGWSAAKPTSYLFGTPGSKSLYAWAKDAAGNISPPSSNSTSIVIQYIVTPTTGSGYAILPSSAQTVINNGTTSFSVTPLAGYGILSVSGCGGSLSGTTYTTSTITANCSIVVTTVARTASTGGTPTITDALKALQAFVGTVTLSSAEKIRYDVAPLSAGGTPLGNGIIDAADIIMLLRRSIGIGSW